MLIALGLLGREVALFASAALGWRFEAALGVVVWAGADRGAGVGFRNSVSLPGERLRSSSGSGCVASQFFLDFGQQLVDHLRGVDPHEPAKEAPPLPSNGTLGRIREPVHAGDADPHMPLCLGTRNSGDVAPDVRLG
jgi:hypothetical protein